MRQTAGIFRNAAVVGEARNCFYVRERRAAQGQPFGLEDARTGLAQTQSRNVLQHVGLHKINTSKRKGEAGFPPPPWSPSRLRRFIRTRRTQTWSTVYSAAASVIGRTEMNVRPLPLA